MDNLGTAPVTQLREELKKLFTKFGKVVSLKGVNSEHGYHAIVEYDTDWAVALAIGANGETIAGNKIKVRPYSGELTDCQEVSINRSTELDQI